MFHVLYFMVHLSCFSSCLFVLVFPRAACSEVVCYIGFCNQCSCFSRQLPEANRPFDLFGFLF